MSLTGTIAGDVFDEIGFPVPIYLNRALTGIQIDNESKAIEVETEFIQSYNPKVPSRYIQKGTRNLVSINMLADRDSLLLTALIAISDLVFEKLIQKTYKVSYFHRSIVILKGLLNGMSVTDGPDDTLRRVVLQLEKGTNIKSQQISTLLKQTSVTPNPGVGL